MSPIKQVRFSLDPFQNPNATSQQGMSTVIMTLPAGRDREGPLPIILLSVLCASASHSEPRVCAH